MCVCVCVKTIHSTVLLYIGTRMEVVHAQHALEKNKKEVESGKKKGKHTIIVILILYLLIGSAACITQ